MMMSLCLTLIPSLVAGLDMPLMRQVKPKDTSTFAVDAGAQTEGGPSEMRSIEIDVRGPVSSEHAGSFPLMRTKGKSTPIKNLGQAHTQGAETGGTLTITDEVREQHELLATAPALSNSSAAALFDQSSDKCISKLSKSSNRCSFSVFTQTSCPITPKKSSCSTTIYDLTSTCYCESGACAGLDMLCHQGDYRRLNGTYTISSAYWPEYFVYTPSWAGSSSGVSGPKPDDNDGKKDFYISVVHSTGSGHGLGVLLISKKYPTDTLVMQMSTTTNTDINGTIKTTTSYSLDRRKIDPGVDIDDTGSLLFIPPPTIQNPSPDEATLVMIRGIERPEFAYVAGWGIKGHKTDKGASMYFYISPPLPQDIIDKMHAYSGVTCTGWDCGSIDDFDSGAHSPFLPRSACWVSLVLFLLATA